MNKNIQFNLVSEELIIQRLQFENPWWTSGQPAEFFAPFEKRLQFSGFQELVEETTIRRAVILMGPRRVGKTVLMHQSIGNLLNQKIPPNQIFYISIENPIYNYRGLEELFHLSLKASGNKDPKGCFLFFDEIQYLKDWEIHLKSLVDSYPYTKFIVS
ncbi:MAG: AAA family ATPase, partial [Ignavibacteriaceae bacterium]|nr:AAA family ATPase [Ignavibacteriaceae bacterium]